MTEITRRGFIGSAAAAVAVTTTGAGAADSESGYDFVVAGAGHNSLITAAYLAKAGFSILIVEGRPTIGGGCKTAETCLPGFHDDVCSSVHGILMSNPLIRDNELNIFDYGLEYIFPDPPWHIPFPDGRSLTMWSDKEKTYAEYAKFSQHDADTFLAMVDELANRRKASAAGQPPSSVWKRKMGMSGYDLIHELFESDYVRSFHLAVGKITSVPAANPGTGNQAYTAIAHQLGGRPIPRGGSGMLSVALGRFIEDHGGVILTSKPVEQLIIEGGKCVGVECRDGSQYRAKKAVVSTIHVKHLAKMAPAESWGQEFLDNLRLFQPEHAMFGFHYATSVPLEYPLENGGTLKSSESVICPYPARILRHVYDDAAGEIVLDDIPLQLLCQTVADPSRAPAGYHTVKILGNLPYGLKEGPGHWDAVKKDVADKIFDYVRGFAPTLTKDKVLAEFLLSPLDIERMNPAFWKGSVHAGGYGDAQMGDMRPVPGFGDYRMPIPGLYQTGACTQPGGSITGKPGRNAAIAILEDQGMTLAEVIGS